MKKMACKVLVVGGGPGGYVCAIRAGQLGLDTIIVEKDALGGTCLNVGCIPSKALIHVAGEFHRASQARHTTDTGITVTDAFIDLGKTSAWKDGIVKRLNTGVAAVLRKAKVQVVSGKACIVDSRTCVVEGAGEPIEISAEHIVIATGSEPIELPELPFGNRVISSTEAVSLGARPNRMVVIGGGYIGVELGMAYAKLRTQVTLLEASSQLLPRYDAELVRPIARAFEALGGRLVLGGAAAGFTADGRVNVRMSNGEQLALETDVVLVTIGRRARLEGFGLEQLGLEKAGSFIAIDRQCRTSAANVWAIGDCTGEPMLAHRAMAQGKVVAEVIAGLNRTFEPACIPAICYGDPELVTVGLSRAEAGAGARAVRFPFAANGRALTSESESGFIRMVFDEPSHRLLGIQAVGSGVAELSSSFAIAIEMGCRVEDVAFTIQAHPTLGEALQEAAMLAGGQGLHL